MKTSDLPKAKLRTVVPSPEDGKSLGTPCEPGCRTPQGNLECHCSVCHRTMRGVRYFDDHRRDGECIDLPAMGLRENNGLWATPEGHTQRAKRSAVLAPTHDRESAH